MKQQNVRWVIHTLFTLLILLNALNWFLVGGDIMNLCISTMWGVNFGGVGGPSLISMVIFRVERFLFSTPNNRGYRVSTSYGTTYWSAWIWMEGSIPSLGYSSIFLLSTSLPFLMGSKFSRDENLLLVTLGGFWWLLFLWILFHVPIMYWYKQIILPLIHVFYGMLGEWFPLLGPWDFFSKILVLMERVALKRDVFIIYMFQVTPSIHIYL